LKPSELESKLQSKFGFSPAKSHSEDHRWYGLHLPDLPPILTKVSHNNKEIGETLEGKIARQLRVKQKIFKGMMGCTINQEEYYKKLKTDPYPPFN